MLRKFFVFIIICLFFVVSAIPVEAQNTFGLPVQSAVEFDAVLSGMRIFPQEPFRFDFLLSEMAVSHEEALRLVKYFMAGLAVPAGDLWVNLSPDEPDRIVPPSLSEMDLGRDLLAQDYILKQLTASLMHPEGEVGQEFWSTIYSKAYEKLGTVDIPVDTFNKVWIVPDQVEVYQNQDVAYVTNATMKVMLESDYVAMSESGRVKSEEIRHPGIAKQYPGSSEILMHDEKLSGFRVKPGMTDSDMTEETKSIIHEVILPVIEHEVNHGKHFAPLRQILNSMILAKWYEQHFKNSIIGQKYVDQKKIDGIELENKNVKFEIYDQYVNAFKTGVYDVLKEEYNPVSQEIIAKRYFSGGMNMAEMAMLFTDNPFEGESIFIQESPFLNFNEKILISSKFSTAVDVDYKPNQGNLFYRSFVSTMALLKTLFSNNFDQEIHLTEQELEQYFDEKVQEKIYDDRKGAVSIKVKDPEGKEIGFNISLTATNESALQIVVDTLNEYIEKDSKVLDIGSGIGHFGNKLIESGVVQKDNFLGVDLSLENTKQAQENGVPQIVGSAYNLAEIEDASYNVISYNESIGAMKTEPAFSEAMRVLKPGGTVFITNLNFPNTKRTLETLGFYYRSVETMKQLLESQGFVNVKIYPVEKDVFQNMSLDWLFGSPRQVDMYVITAQKPDDKAMLNEDIINSNLKILETIVNKGYFSRFTEKKGRDQPDIGSVDLVQDFETGELMFSNPDNISSILERHNIPKRRSERKTKEHQSMYRKINLVLIYSKGGNFRVSYDHFAHENVLASIDRFNAGQRVERKVEKFSLLRVWMKLFGDDKAMMTNPLDIMENIAYELVSILNTDNSYDFHAKFIAFPGMPRVEVFNKVDNDRFVLEVFSIGGSRFVIEFSDVLEGDQIKEFMESFKNVKYLDEDKNQLFYSLNDFIDMHKDNMYEVLSNAIDGDYEAQQNYEKIIQNSSRITDQEMLLMIENFEHSFVKSLFERELGVNRKHILFQDRFKKVKEIHAENKEYEEKLKKDYPQINTSTKEATLNSIFDLINYVQILIKKGDGGAYSYLSSVVELFIDNLGDDLQGMRFLNEKIRLSIRDAYYNADVEEIFKKDIEWYNSLAEIFRTPTAFDQPKQIMHPSRTYILANQTMSALKKLIFEGDIVGIQGIVGQGRVYFTENIRILLDVFKKVNEILNNESDISEWISLGNIKNMQQCKVVLDSAIKAFQEELDSRFEVNVFNDPILNHYDKPVNINSVEIYKRLFFNEHDINDFINLFYILNKYVDHSDVFTVDAYLEISHVFNLLKRFLKDTEGIQQKMDAVSQKFKSHKNLGDVENAMLLNGGQLLQNDVGGIDLNNLDMQTGGNIVPMEIDPAMLNIQIPTLIPQIISISKFEDEAQLAEFLNLDKDDFHSVPENDLYARHEVYSKELDAGIL